MQSNIAKMARQFTKTHIKDIPNSPRALDEETIEFLRKMLDDEGDELEAAMTIGEQADALVDMMFYILDTAASNGINLDPILDIVHGANMEKVVNGVVLRCERTGKVMKPDNWRDPIEDIEYEIDDQDKFGSFRD
jgi:predicted HAD superfamily Cof-like phosphohydrolase